MTRRGSNTRRQPIYAVALGVLAAAGLLSQAGCAHDDYPATQIRPPGRHAMQYYAKARALYLAALAEPLHGPAYRRQMDEAAEHLRAAIDASAGSDDAFVCPLFRTRYGLLLLELDAPGVRPGAQSRAYDLLEKAVSKPTGAPEWVEGWIGLAVWALHAARDDSSKFNDAEGYLRRAEKALEKFEEHARDVQVSILPGGWARPAPRRDPDDPTREASERLALLCAWTAAHELWLDPFVGPQPAAAAAQLPGAAVGPTIGGARLARRLRARIEYLRAVIQDRRGEPAGYVIRRLDEALRWDEDFFPARIEMARQQLRLRNYTRAEAMLRPYLIDAQTQPAFRNSRRLWRIAATLYARLDSEQPTEEHARSAERAFLQLLSLDPENATSWLEFAEYDIVAAEARPHDPPSRRLRLLARARTSLGNARRLGAAERRIGELTNRLERLSAQIAAKTEETP